jgi:colanic acid biosynthesis glycosyl transferase WcaI
MKLLILGLNYAPERVGIAVYTSGMAEALAEMGHEIHVIAGRPYYPGWKIMDGHNPLTYQQTVESGVSVTRVPHYIPAHPSAVRRLLHHASFAFSSLGPMLWRAWTWRPDAVIAIAPSLLAAPIAKLAAVLCGARSWLHIQDFEVEAARATGLMQRHGLLARLAGWFENYLFGQFDQVSSISSQMCHRLVEKGVRPERVYQFGNWANNSIRPLEAPPHYRSEWNIITPNVALYAGSIANKQGIDIVIDAARLLQDRTDLTFVICGQGPNRKRLEASAAGLPNVQFRELQPAAHLNDLLGLATMHLLPQIIGAADLVLPSKLGNMLASGRPIVATADPGTGLFDAIDGCGVLVEPGDATAFAAAIVALIEDDSLRSELSAAAVQRATERWDRHSSIAAFANHLAHLCNDRFAPDGEPQGQDA